MLISVATLPLVSIALAASPAALKPHPEYKFTLPAAEAKLAVSDDSADMDKLVASPAFALAMNKAAKTLFGKSCEPDTLSTIHNESTELAGLLESVKSQAAMAQKPSTYQYARIQNGYYTLMTNPGFSPGMGLWVLVGKSAAMLNCKLK